MTSAVQEPDLATLARQVRELVDHQEISELISRLGQMLDERRFDDARDIFTEDARDLAEDGRQHLSSFARVQHVITNPIIDLDRDRATIRASLLATHIHRAEDPTRHFTVGGRYRFEANRSSSGWRLSAVELHILWTKGRADEEWLARASATGRTTRDRRG